MTAVSDTFPYSPDPDIHLIFICFDLSRNHFFESKFEVVQQHVPKHLAPHLRQRLLRDDVINDVTRPGSTIRDHINTPYRGNRVKISSNSDKKLLEKKHFKEKS